MGRRGEGAAILEARNGKAKRKPAKKSRDSRVGSTLVKRGKGGGGGGGEEEGWRRDNRCIKIPNLNERSFRSSSNGGLSTVACFLSNDLTTIFETIAALSRVACPPYRISNLSLFILFFFLLTFRCTDLNEIFSFRDFRLVFFKLDKLLNIDDRLTKGIFYYLPVFEKSKSKLTQNRSIFHSIVWKAI